MIQAILRAYDYKIRFFSVKISAAHTHTMQWEEEKNVIAYNPTVDAIYFYNSEAKHTIE